VVTELTPEQIPEAAQWFADQPHPAPYAAARQNGGDMLWLVSGCGDCHAESVKDDADMPWLSSQHPAYLSKQMHDIRGGLRPGDPKGRMTAQLRALSAPEIETLAIWLSTRERAE
jgi:cytochrome c553